MKTSVHVLIVMAVAAIIGGALQPLSRTAWAQTIRQRPAERKSEVSPGVAPGPCTDAGHERGDAATARAPSCADESALRLVIPESVAVHGRAHVDHAESSGGAPSSEASAFVTIGLVVNACDSCHVRDLLDRTTPVD